MLALLAWVAYASTAYATATLPDPQETTEPNSRGLQAQARTGFAGPGTYTEATLGQGAHVSTSAAQGECIFNRRKGCIFHRP